MKIFAATLLFVGFLFFSFHMRADDSRNSPHPRYEKIGAKQGGPIKISNEDLDEGNKATLQAIQNSSPEVKAALLKAAKELAEKKSD